jgi:hypothetical protein
MTVSSIHDGKHWRGRAEEMRALADLMHHAETKAKVIKLAEDYEKLATKAERAAQKSRSPT